MSELDDSGNPFATIFTAVFVVAILCFLALVVGILAHLLWIIAEFGWQLN